MLDRTQVAALRELLIEEFTKHGLGEVAEDRAGMILCTLPWMKEEGLSLEQTVTEGLEVLLTRDNRDISFRTLAHIVNSVSACIRSFYEREGVELPE